MQAKQVGRVVIMALGILAAVEAGASQRRVTTGEVFHLDAVLTRPDFWSLPVEELGHAVGPAGFSWLDTQKSAMRGGERIKLGFLNQDVWEAQIQLASNQAVRVDLSLYNHGDAGDLSPAAFSSLLGKTQAALSNWTGVAGTVLPDQPGAMRSKVQRMAWQKPPTRLELEWSITKQQIVKGTKVDYRAEFIRLKLLPAGVSNAAPARIAAPAAVKPGRTAAELKMHVRTEENGDVFIANVPMVDQGDKGYCAAAVTARIMRYFGLDFDEHQAAQAAGTKSKGGTSSGSLIDGLKQIALKNSLRVVVLDQIEIQRLVTDYNRAANTAKKTKVSLGTGHVIDVDKIYGDMDGEVLRAVRTKRKDEVNHFKTEIVKNVETGIPLIWGVYLGLVKEQFLTPQTKGGHMRMIIGLNKKTDEVLYSDTWGAGHELKRMSLEDALTITRGLYIVKPNNL
jgi:hypothetical protein